MEEWGGPRDLVADQAGVVMAIALSVLTILAAVVPMLLEVLKTSREGRQRATDALVQLDIDSLRKQLELQQQQSVSAGHPPGPSGPA